MKKFFKHPWIIVAVISIITIFFALQLPKATLDNNTFRFVPVDNPARVAHERVDEQYGSQISILVGFKRSYGSVLEADFLLRLKDFIEKAEKLDRVSSVTSIMNADYISGDAETITVAPLVSESFSGTQEEILALKEKLMDWELYRKALISDDFKSTQVLVNIAGSSEDSGSGNTVILYDQLKALSAGNAFPGTEVYLTGLPAFTSVMNSAMRSDLFILIPLVFLVVLGVLFLSFRKLAGIVLPILTVLISTIWSVGLMAFLGIKLSMLATVLPVILVAVGSAYGIHIISHYYDEIARQRNVTKERHAEIIFHVLKRIGRPILLAALTTLAGFVSLAFTSVVPIQEFGIFASFGVVVAFIVAMALIPSLLIIRGPAKINASAGANVGLDDENLDDAHLEADLFSRSIATLFGIITQKRRTVLFVTIAIIISGAYFSSKLIMDNVIIEYFKPDTDIVKSDVFIRTDFAGSKTLNLTVKGKEKGSLNNPIILKAMDDLGTYLEAEVPEVGKVTGYQHLIKRINQVFNSGEAATGLTVQEETVVSEDTGFGFGDWSTDTQATEGTASNLNTNSTIEANALTELKAVELLNRALADSKGEKTSAAELVRSLAKATNYKGATYYEIPSDPIRYGKKNNQDLQDLIGNYLILLSGDLSAWTNDALEPSEARMTIQLKAIGQADTQRVVDAINRYTKEQFPKDYSVEVTGTAMVEQALNQLVVSSQLWSVGTSLLMVFLILAVYYWSISAGLIGIFTLSLTVLINFAVMGLTGIKLNIGTAMVASIAVGTGIDYIIHYMAAYHHETLTQSDKSRVLRRTFLTSGKAILFNAISVGLGFAVLILSQFNMLAYLGFLIAVAMFSASVTSLTVLPVLLEWFKPKFIQKALRWDRKNTK